MNTAPAIIPELLATRFDPVTPVKLKAGLSIRLVELTSNCVFETTPGLALVDTFVLAK